MMRRLAAGLWGGLSAVLILFMVGQGFGVVEPVILGAGLALAVLIGMGGRPGLLGAMVGASLGLGTLVSVSVISFVFGATDVVYELSFEVRPGPTLGPWLIVISATVTLVSGLAAREMWKARAHST